MTEKKDKIITRRDFLKGAGATALGISAFGLPALTETAHASAKSTVVLVRHKNAVSSNGRYNGEVIQTMLDNAMVTLFGNNNVNHCWRQILKPSDLVGIKTNSWYNLSTSRQVEQAIKKRVIDAGVSRKNLSIDDRGILSNKVFLNATALINARPMRTHSWSGVGSLLKNYIMFVDTPSDYHSNSCMDLGAIWNMPLVKNKTRLNVLVMLTPLFHNVGPHHFDKEYTWNYGGLIVGTDPVACDTVGLKIIQNKRRQHFGNDRPLKPVAHHIEFADKKHHIGNSNLSKINIIRLGWKKDSLV